jgi:Rab GDP dissociation inhibitor
MLRAPVETILTREGKFAGVIVEGKVAKAKQCVCDPSYVPDKVQKVYQVARAIVILNHQPDCLKQPYDSCQIIMPNNQIGRRSDIYVCVVGSKNEVAPKNYYIGIVSTTCETGGPNWKNELRPGLDLLGSAVDVFYTLDDYYEPLNDGRASDIYVSSSYDPTTHFETTCIDIVNIFRTMTGSDIDFDNLPYSTEEEE